MFSALSLKGFSIVAILTVALPHVQTNCLQPNPKTLHAVFNWYNKANDPWNVTTEELWDMLDLFETRFDRAYNFAAIPIHEYLVTILNIAKYRKVKSKSISTYFTNYLGQGKTKNDSVNLLLSYKYMMTKVEQDHEGTIGGLLLQTNLPTFLEDLEVYTEVFGPLNSTEFNLGISVQKSDLSKNKALLRQFGFLVVVLPEILSGDPEFIAESIVKECDEAGRIARSKRITAEISCRVSFPSDGPMGNRSQESLKKFGAFWCRIEEILNDEEYHCPIIMNSAFDNSPEIKFRKNDLNKRLGWWRRVSDNRSDHSAFVEKVNEIHTTMRGDGNQPTVSPLSDRLRLIGSCMTSIVMLSIFL